MRRRYRRSARRDDAVPPQAGQALPQDGEQEGGGPLDPGVAVVEPVLSPRLQQADHGAGHEAGGGAVAPRAGDALDAGPTGRLHGRVLQGAGGGHQLPGGLVVAGELEVAADEAAEPDLVGQLVVEGPAQLAVELLEAL